MISARIAYHADGSVAHPIPTHSRTPDCMEHRLHQRTPVFIPVRLRFCDGTAIKGIAANLSRGGIFIETPNCAFRRGCGDICMPIPWRRGDCELHIPAFVVHGSEDGIGLMFRELDTDTDEMLRDLIHSRMPLPGQMPQMPGRPGRPWAPVPYPGR